MNRQGAIAPPLAHLADELYSIKNKLEKLELTQAWSLRETDLFELQKPLMAIDDARVGGKFVGKDGTTPYEGQSVSSVRFTDDHPADSEKILLYLLRRSYAHIYTLMSSSEVIVYGFYIKPQHFADIFNSLSAKP